MPPFLVIVGVIGAGLPSVLAILLLAGAGVVLWSGEHPPPDVQAVQYDLPLRLLRWAGGLLRTDRVEWSQAMLGELDRIEGRSGRWRFALGCVANIVLLPPWGPVAPMAVMGTVAVGSAVVFGFGFVHFGLPANPWNWVVVLILRCPPDGFHRRGERAVAPARCGSFGSAGGALRRDGMVGVLWVHVGWHHQPD